MGALASEAAPRLTIEPPAANGLAVSGGPTCLSLRSLLNKAEAKCIALGCSARGGPASAKAGSVSAQLAGKTFFRPHRRKETQARNDLLLERPLPEDFPRRSKPWAGQGCETHRML